ncbi:hypothetical protein FACS189426_16240 [Bacteroidia bacterium]|nr:hypothetical protein FACS189426_16240 [Bacteroidia bacterium]GHT84355.1 hypothetical protein FACS18947_1680 [Bacteroidia bacterium]
MERYVTQLIEDLQAAQTLKISPIYTAREDEMIKGSFEKFFGIDAIVFPPAERLSESQQIALSNAITALYDAHRYILNITMIKDLPASVLYQYLVKMWTESLYYVTDGLAGLEFCEDDPEKCSLRKWCKGTWCEVPDDYLPSRLRPCTKGNNHYRISQRLGRKVAIVPFQIAQSDRKEQGFGRDSLCKFTEEQYGRKFSTYFFNEISERFVMDFGG